MPGRRIIAVTERAAKTATKETFLASKYVFFECNFSLQLVSFHHLKKIFKGNLAFLKSFFWK
jgi:hypothetical protein